MTMKIDIITFHNTSNFGATLQCCAMSRYLQQLGHEVEIINYLPQYVLKKKSVFKYFKRPKTAAQLVKSTIVGTAYAMRAAKIIGKDRKYENFISKNLKLTKPYHTFEELLQNPPTADLYLCGSDQIWNSVLTGGQLDEAFFLEFAKGRKVSYGVSLGELDVEANKEKLRDMTLDFEALSVRERTSSYVLSEVLERPVEQVLDCTLLLEKQDYSTMESELQSTKKPYLLLYNIHQSVTTTGIAKEEAKKRNLQIIDISPNPLVKINGTDHLVNIGPAEFLSLFRHASYVVTNSFHGTVFSVIYEKPFVTVPHSVRSSRMTELMEALQIKDRLAYEYGYEDPGEIDYVAVKHRLDELRAQSFRYIDRCLSSDQKESRDESHAAVRKESKTENNIPNLVPQRFLCCGCGACSEICPKGAITMAADQEGFLYPQVDSTKCIRCNQCLRVCAFKREMKPFL